MKNPHFNSVTIKNGVPLFGQLCLPLYSSWVCLVNVFASHQPFYAAFGRWLGLGAVLVRWCLAETCITIHVCFAAKGCVRLKLKAGKGFITVLLNQKTPPLRSAARFTNCGAESLLFTFFLSQVGAFYSPCFSKSGRVATTGIRFRGGSFAYCS